MYLWDLEAMEILVESNVEKIVMPDNLKVGLMIAEQRKKCADGGCHEEFYALLN